MRGTCIRCNSKFNKKSNEQVTCNKCLKSDVKEDKNRNKRPTIHIYKDLAGYFYFACKIDNKVKTHVKTIFNESNKIEKFNEFKYKYNTTFGEYDNKPIKFNKNFYNVEQLETITV